MTLYHQVPQKWKIACRRKERIDKKGNLIYLTWQWTIHKGIPSTLLKCVTPEQADYIIIELH